MQIKATDNGQCIRLFCKMSDGDVLTIDIPYITDDERTVEPILPHGVNIRYSGAMHHDEILAIETMFD